MASEWICYLENQEFGPVSEQDLMELIREGTVPVNTYIRRPTDTEWTTVEQVFGPDVLKRQDFSPQAAVTATAESRVFTDSPTMVNLPSHGGNEWYWHVAGETFGPGDISMVMELCQQGLISPDDFVRIGQGSEWMKAGTIEELFPATPSFVDSPGSLSPPPAPPAGVGELPGDGLKEHSAAMLADETKLLQQLLDLLQKNPSLNQLAAPAAPTSSIPADQQWYCLVSGHEVGPMSIETVVQMVLQGRIFPGDVIRLGNTGEWFPASSVEGLFPKATAAPAAPESTAPVESEYSSDKLANTRDIPEYERVLQGIDRLYKASEEAAKELEEKAQKEGKKVEKNKVIGTATNMSASRQAADSIIKNYSQFAITAAEKKKAEELASKVPLSEQIRQNWIKIVIVLAVVVGFISILIAVSSSLAP